MKLEFDRLSVAGFGPFNDKTILTFDPGLHFIRGQNKAEPRLEANDVGKSTLFKALTWALYGKTVENLRNTDIVPWSGNQETKVIVALRIDGEPHKVTRTVNPSNLTLDGKKVGQDDIINLVGISYEVFCHTVLLGQGQPLFFDKTPSEKMQVLSDVLNLERWEAYSKVAGKRVTELEQRKSKLEGEVMGVERSLHELAGLIDRAKGQRQIWDNEQAKRLVGWEGKLKGYETELEKVLKVWDEAVLSRDGAGMELEHLGKRYKDQCRNSQVLDLKMVAKKAELDNLKRFRSKLKNTCPTCGQKVNPATVRKNLAEYEAALAQFDKEIAHLGIELDNASQAVEVSKQQLETFEQREAKATAKVENLTPRKVELETKIRELKNYRAEEKETINPYLEQLETLRKKYKRLQADQDEIRGGIIKATKGLERAQFWVKGFKDVRLFIVDELLSELELVTNTMLEDVGLEGWTIAYSIEKETKSGTFSRGLNVTIRSPRNNEAVKWEVWGGGVGQRLRLIGSLALSEVLLNEANVHPNLEILDEPTRGLATGGVNDLVELLAARAESAGKTILFVDHHLVRSARFASTIEVVKDKKGSYIAS